MSNEHFPLARQKVYVAGHRGMVGAAIVRRLEQESATVLTAPRSLDLRSQADTCSWLAEQTPDVVIVAAAKVGGIHANSTYPAEFLYDNLAIASNLIHGAHECDVDRLMFLGSSCIYPRLAEQPIAESSLLTGPLEPTNEAYAIAKIAGIKLCDAYRTQYGRHYISAMPTNLFGPGDNFHPENSHVIPALLRRFHEAKVAGAGSVTLWGSGRPLREFMYVDDLADALIFTLQRYDELGPLNIGNGDEHSIAELARCVADTVGFTGELVYDSEKPDGTPRKLMDSSRLHRLGWQHKVQLAEGLALSYQWFLDNQDSFRGQVSAT